MPFDICSFTTSLRSIAKLCKHVYLIHRTNNYRASSILVEKVKENEKITLMNELIEDKKECMFTDLLTRDGNPMDVICAFMAILEAVKFSANFSDIF